MTVEEISKASGLPNFMVETVSWSSDWDFIPARTMESFTKACGVDLSSTRQMRRVEDYIRKNPTFKYLRRDVQWKEYFIPMLRKWRKSYSPEQLAAQPATLRRLLKRLDPLL